MFEVKGKFIKVLRQTFFILLSTTLVALSRGGITMSNTNNIRQRSSAKNGAGNVAIHILRDVSESSGVSTVIRKTNKTLHNTVWNRLIAIVVLFTILALFTSRIERYAQSVGAASVRAGGRNGPSFVTIVMPRYICAISVFTNLFYIFY